MLRTGYRGLSAKRGHRSGRAPPLYKRRSTVPISDRGKKWNIRSRTLPLFIVALLLTVNLMFPVDQIAVGEGRSSSPDYGIFDRISHLNDEQETRVDDEDVVKSVEDTLGWISTHEYDFEPTDTSSFNIERITYDEPLTKSPVIFDALSSHPIINNTEVLDWLLPAPLSDQGTFNYLVFTGVSGVDTWSLGSMVPRIGLFTDSSLDKWLYIDADGDPDTGDTGGYDLRARMTFARDILERDWEVTLFPPSLSFQNAGMRMEVEALDTTHGSSDLGGNIFFVKGISYEGRNYIWSMGYGLETFQDRLEVNILAKKWTAEPDTGIITQLLSGNINLRDMNFLDIMGPYTISYDFNTPPEGFDIFISVMRVQDQVLRDMAYLNLDLASDETHDTVIEQGRILLKVKDMGSQIDGIEWRAGVDGKDLSDTLDFTLRYAEFGEDLVDAQFSVPVLPTNLIINISAQERDGKNETIVDIITPEGIDMFILKESYYRNWTKGAPLGVPDVMELVIEDVPPSIHIQTTSSVPFETEDGSVSTITGSILDVFMGQTSSRFYRIGTILREIPRSVKDLPGNKGWTTVDCFGEKIGSVDYSYSNEKYIKGSGNLIGFYVQDNGDTAISLHVEDVSYYSTRFMDQNEMSIMIEDAPTIKIVALDGARISSLELVDPPSRIDIETSSTMITYRGTKGGVADDLGALRYRLREDDILFDVNIIDVPSDIRINKGGGLMDISIGGGSVGAVELFVSNSTSLPPLSMVERNFVSVRIENGSCAMGFRINRLKGLTYHNGSLPFINISTAAEANFYALVEDADSELHLRCVFKPLPAYTHINLNTILDRPEFAFPDLAGIQSITEYADMLFSLSTIAQDILSVVSGLSESLTNAVGTYSTDLSIKWDLAQEDRQMDLILEIEKKGKHDLPDPHWTHGIWIEQVGSGKDGSLKGRIFLQGMPARGEMDLSFSSETMSARFDLEGYSPDHDWMLIRTSGVQDRDISLYLTEFKKGMNLKADMNIVTNLSIGGRMIIDLEVDITDVAGEPIALGPMLGTLRQASPILSVRQMYLPRIPSSLRFNASLEDGIELDYTASQEIEYLYFKILKYMDGRWSQIYAVFGDIPLEFSISMTQNPSFSIQDPFPLQGLPELTLETSSSKLDMFISYDGSGVGQRGRYQVYGEDIGNTRTYLTGDQYIIDSDGISFLSIEMDRIPTMESFTITSMQILAEDLEHMKMSIDMLWGVYPIFRIDETRGGGLQVRLSGDIHQGGRDISPNIFLITLKKKTILGIPVVTGVSVTRDSTVVDLSSGDGNTVLPAPMLTFWYWSLGSIFGGG